MSETAVLRRPGLVVGLTGGIGSGKSAAAQAFEALGAPVIDADRVARDVVSPGSPEHARVVDIFGRGALGADGSLDRRAIRERVFASDALRRRLEAILHPAIRERMARELDGLGRHPYALLAIPLLVESGGSPLVDRVLVVDCAEALQVSRTASRDGTDAAQVRAIMAAQVSRSRRLEAADDVLSNDGDLAQLQHQVELLHRRYKKLAAKKTASLHPPQD